MTLSPSSIIVGLDCAADCRRRRFASLRLELRPGVAGEIHGWTWTGAAILKEIPRYARMT